MSFTSELMATGVPDTTAGVLDQQKVDRSPARSVTTGITAAGTTIADATALTSFLNVVGTTAASTGVKLPSTFPIGQVGIVQNDGANALNLFPHSSSGTINGGSAGAAVTIASAAANIFFKTSATNWQVYALAKES
jgi:hypothetical protein